MGKIIEKLEGLLEWGGTLKDVICLVLGGISLAISLFDLVPLPFDAAWIAIILCGLPIILEAIIGLVTAFDIKADVLVSLALVASVLIGEDFAAGEVAFIMQLGALLEELTVSKARAGIEKLVHLTPQTARILTANGEKIIPAEQVAIGDRIRVLPGETIPVDGVILSGQTSINQAVMTGESLPVDKTVGDEVSSGTVNQFGAFEMEAAKVGEDKSYILHGAEFSGNCAGRYRHSGTGCGCTGSQCRFRGCDYKFCIAASLETAITGIPRWAWICSCLKRGIVPGPQLLGTSIIEKRWRTNSTVLCMSGDSFAYAAIRQWNKQT